MKLLHIFMLYAWLNIYATSNIVLVNEEVIYFI